MEIKDLKKNQSYRIKGNSTYFFNKYGTCNPIFRYEDTDVNVWGKTWGIMQHNPTAILFGLRTGMEGIVFNIDSDPVCYGHIGPLAELCHPSELEEIGEETK